MDLLTIAFAFVAGLLSFLNPCVLPLLPVILAAACSTHRFGPLALAAGLALSFVTLGIFVATIGFTLGVDGTGLQKAAAVLLIVIGVVLMAPRLQGQVALAAGPLVNWADRRFGGFSQNSLAGQFGVGLLLGIVWTPCVGPTLGAVSIFAAQGRDLGHVALAMTVFAVGSALPLVVLGLISRQALIAWRGRLLAAGSVAKIALGIMLVAIGALILTGLDKPLQTVLVDAMPEWLSNLTTRF